MSICQHDNKTGHNIKFENTVTIATTTNTTERKILEAPKLKNNSISTNETTEPEHFLEISATDEQATSGIQCEPIVGGREPIRTAQTLFIYISVRYI